MRLLRTVCARVATTAVLFTKAENTAVTEPMRSKEHAHDYRYLHYPDLLPFEPTNAWRDEVRSRLVDLPLRRKNLFIRNHGSTAGDDDVVKNNVAQ